MISVIPVTKKESATPACSKYFLMARFDNAFTQTMLAFPDVITFPVESAGATVDMFLGHYTGLLECASDDSHHYIVVPLEEYAQWRHLFEVHCLLSGLVFFELLQDEADAQLYMITSEEICEIYAR
jgi:hypothetical protein